MQLQEAFKSQIIRPYLVSVGNYTYPVHFWIGKKEIKTHAREGQSFASETRRAAKNEKGEYSKNVPCVQLHVARGKFTLDSYYFTEGKFNKPCVKPPRKEMFALFELFAVELGYNEIHLNDVSSVKLTRCDWDLPVLEKIRTGRTFYEKQGYEYVGKYPDLSGGIQFLKGSVKKYAKGANTLKEVVQRMHTDCTSNTGITKPRRMHYRLTKQIKTHFNIHEQFVKHLPCPMSRK
jgi:hypothetical protein